MVNLYRSAISANQAPVHTLLVAKHPLVCHLQCGVRVSRPPVTCYSQLWDITAVLN